MQNLRNKKKKSLLQKQLSPTQI